MKVKYQPRLTEGSCNFCNRGVFHPDSQKFVFAFEGEHCGLKVRICDHCLTELYEKSILAKITDRVCLPVR